MPRRHGFCSGTPPRSEGGGKGCGGRSRSAREAAPLQKGARPSAWTSARKVPRASLPVGISPGPRASKPACRRAGAWAAACATHPLRTKSPRSRKCPAASTAPGNAGFQARLPSRKPLASPCACPLRGVVFCSGTPPRSGGGVERAAGPTPVGAGSRAATEGGCRAATDFVAERLRVPRGVERAAGAAPDRRGKPRRYKKAPDLAHGQAPARCHGHPCPWGFPRDRGLPSPHAEGQAHGPRHAPRTRCGLKVRAPGNAQPRARPPGTRASKPACLRGSPWQVPAHARFAALHFVAERLRVPGGGVERAAGRTPDRRGKPRRYKKANASPPNAQSEIRDPQSAILPRSRSAREAAPLQKGGCRAAR